MLFWENKFVSYPQKTAEHSAVFRIITMHRLKTAYDIYKPNRSVMTN